MPIRFAGVEGGGTGWKVAISEGRPDNIIEEAGFDTTTPEETLGKIKSWLDKREYDTIGIATFGPVDCKVGSPTYGKITNTPKPGWQNIDVVGTLTDGTKPCKFDTDVNAPAYAEYKYNSPSTATSCAYITVGTGVGVGLVINGKPVHGLMHPEGGHLPCKRLPGDDFKGVEPYHFDCVEGLACSQAIAERSGMDRRKLVEITDDNEVWDKTAHALGSLCASIVLLTSVERIVISGGIMQRKVLFPLVRKHTQKILNSYVQHPLLTTADGIANYIVPSKWGNRAGLVGSLTLAEAALEEEEESKAGGGGVGSCFGLAGPLKKLGIWRVSAGVAVACIAIPLLTTTAAVLLHGHGSRCPAISGKKN